MTILETDHRHQSQMAVSIIEMMTHITIPMIPVLMSTPRQNTICILAKETVETQEQMVVLTTQIVTPSSRMWICV